MLFQYWIEQTSWWNLCFCVRQAVEEFLAELRCLEESQNADLVSQMTAVKFLVARKFDVSRAIDLFQAYKVQYTVQLRW